MFSAKRRRNGSQTRQTVMGRSLDLASRQPAAPASSGRDVRAGSNRRWRRSRASFVVVVSLRSAPARGSSFRAAFEIALTKRRFGPCKRSSRRQRHAVGNSVVAEAAVGGERIWARLILTGVMLARRPHQRGEFTPLGFVSVRHGNPYCSSGSPRKSREPGRKGSEINMFTRVPSSPVHRQARSVTEALHLRLQPYLPPTARRKPTCSEHFQVSTTPAVPYSGAHPRAPRTLIHGGDSPSVTAQHRASDRVRGTSRSSVELQTRQNLQCQNGTS